MAWVTQAMLMDTTAISMSIMKAGVAATITFQFGMPTEIAAPAAWTEFAEEAR